MYSHLIRNYSQLFANYSHTVRTLFAHYSQLFATIRTPRSYKLRGDFTMNRCPCVQREGSPEIEQVGKPSTSSLYSHLIHKYKYKYKYSQVFAGIRELFARCSRTIRKVFATIRNYSHRVTMIPVVCGEQFATIRTYSQQFTLVPGCE